LFAAVFADNLSPDTVPTISVTIDDNASEGCWTNIGEAKAYSEDKLKLLGYNVIPKHMDYYLVLEVHAKRTSNGGCYGDVSTAIVTYGKMEGHMGEHVLAEMGLLFVNSKNVNIILLDNISLFMKELE
jgi:hypothetical protein